MKNKIFILLAGIALLASSCTVNRKTVPGAPIHAQVQLSMADMDYVGDVTGTATQSYVLGIIPVGGRRFHEGRVTNQGLGIIPNLRGVDNAMYDALTQRPDADFVLPFATTRTINYMFLGRKETITVKAKAFKLRTK